MKLHIEHAQRNPNFRIQSEITERAAVTQGKGAEFLHQAKDRRMLPVESKRVLFKRGLL